MKQAFLSGERPLASLLGPSLCLLLTCLPAVLLVMSLPWQSQATTSLLPPAHLETTILYSPGGPGIPGVPASASQVLCYLCSSEYLEAFLMQDTPTFRSPYHHDLTPTGDFCSRVESVFI